MKIFETPSMSEFPPSSPKNFYRLIQGNVMDVLPTLESESIHLVVTSPPYWGLRDYGSSATMVWDGSHNCEYEWSSYSFNQHAGRGDCQKSGKYSEQETIPDKQLDANFCVSCGAWRGQLGLEPHPQLYIQHLVQVCRELKRVLRKDGSFYLNMGDTYYGSGGKGGQYEKFSTKKGTPNDYKQNSSLKSNWLQPKQLLLIPSRTAMALQDDGWILRNDIVWHKNNHMPSSARDRLTNSWEHVFHFVKSRRYYYNLDVIRVPHKAELHNPGNKNRAETIAFFKSKGSGGHFENPNRIWGKSEGKNPSDLLEADYFRPGSDKPLSQHQKWEREGNACGSNESGKNPSDYLDINTRPFKGAHFAVFPEKLVEPMIKSSCPDGGVVLDPFAGSGTTMKVAQNFLRSCTCIEVVPSYCEMIRKRCFGKTWIDRETEYSFEVL